MNSKINLIDDVLEIKSDSSKPIQTLQHIGVRFYLSVPLMAEEKVALILGWLSLVAETPGIFKAEHIKRVSEVAGILSLAAQANLNQKKHQSKGDLPVPITSGSASVTEFMPSWQSGFPQLQQASTKNQELEGMVRQQAQREQIGWAITKQIAKGESLAEILQSATIRVREYLQTSRILIYRFREHQPTQVIAESIQEGVSPMLGLVLPEEPGTTATEYLRRYQADEIEIIEDITTAGFTDSLVKLWQFFKIKSMVAVPLLEKPGPVSTQASETPQTPDRLWGLLVAHQCDRQRYWQTAELEFLCAIAAQLEVAIVNHRLAQRVRLLENDLAEQLQQQKAELGRSVKAEGVLKRITDQVRDNLDENQILETAVRELALVLKVEACNSALYSRDQSTATISYQHSSLKAKESKRKGKKAMPARLNGPLPVGETVRIDELPAVYSQLLEEKSIQLCPIRMLHQGRPWSILASPIFHNQGVIGDLWLFKSDGQEFSDVEVQLVELVANHCAIAIRQARLYQAAQTQVAELEKVNRLKDDFLSTISHELRTPLSNMKMALQMLAIALNQEREFFADLAKPERERGKVARYFQIVRNECEREIALINDLLELQQLDTNSQAWAPATIELQRVIPSIAQAFEQLAKKHRQTFEMDIPADLPPLFGDPVILERILKELLTNACKYTPAEEKIILSVRVSLERLVLKVSNSGSEIPPEEIKKIFDKFYRIPKADRWHQGGTGLGLAVLQKLTERLKGSVEVVSQDGLTCFTVQLPMNGFLQRYQGLPSTQN